VGDDGDISQIHGVTGSEREGGFEDASPKKIRPGPQRTGHALLVAAQYSQELAKNNDKVRMRLAFRRIA
jgi:hypothetical protein